MRCGLETVLGLSVHVRKTKADVVREIERESVPLRGTGQAGLQEEVQAHRDRRSVEHVVAFADAVGDEGCL